MTLEELNSLSAAEASEQFQRCCGAQRWVDAMVSCRPFSNRGALFAAADDAWTQTDRSDWLEAFQHHPRIGDVEGLRTKFATTAQWATGEQAGAALANEETLQALAEGNRLYEERFGFIFIVCATGKSAAEMLALLQQRLNHDIDQEWSIAAAEQHKITLLRLEKLLG